MNLTVYVRTESKFISTQTWLFSKDFYKILSKYLFFTAKTILNDKEFVLFSYQHKQFGLKTVTFLSLNKDLFVHYRHKFTKISRRAVKRKNIKGHGAWEISHKMSSKK